MFALWAAAGRFRDGDRRNESSATGGLRRRWLALVIRTCRHRWTVSNEQRDGQGELKAAAREVDFWQISDSRDRIAKLIVVTDEATPEPTAIGI